MPHDHRPIVFDARWVLHAILTAVLAWFAVRLWWPDETFSGSHAFDAMAAAMHEDRWAGVFWAGAMTGTVGMVTRNTVLRFISTGVVSTLHGITVGFLLKSHVGLLPGVLFFLAIGGYYLMARRALAGL